MVTLTVAAVTVCEPNLVDGGFYSINSFCLLPETPTLLQSVPDIWQYLQTFSIRIASSKRTKVHGRPLVKSCHGDSWCQASINVGFVSPWCPHITQTWSSLTQLKTAVSRVYGQNSSLLNRCCETGPCCKRRGDHQLCCSSVVVLIGFLIDVRLSNCRYIYYFRKEWTNQRQKKGVFKNIHRHLDKASLCRCSLGKIKYQQNRHVAKWASFIWSSDDIKITVVAMWCRFFIDTCAIKTH